jgi:peptide subunit release factor 1 (eRF1)
MTDARSEVADVIRTLARLRPGSHHVVSCYLRLELDDRVRKKYFTTLKGAVAEATTAAAGLEPASRRPIERDLRRVLRAVENPARLPAAPGVAIFACEPRKVFLAVPMPRVHHTRVVVDQRPQIRELLVVAEEAGRLLLAAFDRKVARFFEITAFDVRELPGLWTASTRGGKFQSDRGDSPGWGEQSFHHRIEEERHRHFEAVGRRLAELDRERPAQGILLAGPLDDTRSAERFLPASLSARFMGATRLNPTAVRPAQVRAAALQLHREWERRRERELIAGLEANVGDGWSANGPQPTLRALARGQVRTLLIRSELTGSGYRCADTGRLVLSKAECRGEGTPVPVPDLVNEAIEEALRQRVEIAVVHEPELAEAIDGLAAVLRFR